MKHYRAHLAPVVSVSASADGQLFASVAEDGSAKVFDVVNFGPLNIILLVHLHSFDTTTLRHDQYDQTGLRATYVLLGAQTR